MESKVKSIGISALKTVILMALTLAISALVRFLFVDNMFEQEYFSNQVLNVWHMIFFLLIFNSLFFAISISFAVLYFLVERYKRQQLIIISIIPIYIIALYLLIEKLG